MNIAALPSDMLCIDVERGKFRSHHTFKLSKYVKGSDKLSHALAAIGSDNKFTCYFNTGSDGKTTVEVDILSGNSAGTYTRKLCLIVLALATETHTPAADVLINIDKAITVTLSELQRALDFQPDRARAVDATVRKLSVRSA